MESIFGWISNNPDIERPGKIILICTFGLIPAFLVGMVVWGVFFSEPWGLKFLNDSKQEFFSGRIDSIYHETQNHNAEVAQIGNYKLGLWSEWDGIISIGDSLYKQKGTTYIEVFKTNGQKKILNYADIIRNRK